jgi:hypothetical protein
VAVTVSPWPTGALVAVHDAAAFAPLVGESGPLHSGVAPTLKVTDPLGALTLEPATIAE